MLTILSIRIFSLSIFIKHFVKNILYDIYSFTLCLVYFTLSILFLMLSLTVSKPLFFLHQRKLLFRSYTAQATTEPREYRVVF